MSFSSIRPYQHVALRLPNDQTKIEQLQPNTLINLGKYGSFYPNQLFGRPYYLTFEIQERSETRESRELRIVPAAELNAIELLEQAEAEGGISPGDEVDEYGLPTGGKSNVNIIDDPTNQTLTMTEIEALKQDEMGSAKDLIAKIMSSHTRLDQKTAFSLAKYTLRKHKKYLKRFTVLPLDVATLTDFMMVEKEWSKIMELRNETIALIGCWANVHASGPQLPDGPAQCRYLVVDDSGGLIVAAMAERMGILHPPDVASEPQPQPLEEPDEGSDSDELPASSAISTPRKPSRQAYAAGHMSATQNTLTLVHSNQQPNLALLRYFNFDSNLPSSSHSLYYHLKTLSWLQLLEPESDAAYTEPASLSPEEIKELKSNRKSNYFRKRRRWGKIKSVVDSTRAGGFNGLVVASYTDPTSIISHLVPLLAGGAQIVVYHPHIEPLMTLTDSYSTARRTAYISLADDDPRKQIPNDDFPVDPTLCLVPSVQTIRVRPWQVLPGRTHPLMTGKGGGEGYVWVTTRVIPIADGQRVSARGHAKRARSDAGSLGKADLSKTETPPSSTVAELDEGGNASKKAKVDEGRIARADEQVDVAVEEVMMKDEDGDVGVGV